MVYPCGTKAVGSKELPATCPVHGHEANENEIRAQECDSLRHYMHSTDKHIGDVERCNWSVCCDLQVRAYNLRAAAPAQRDAIKDSDLCAKVHCGHTAKEHDDDGNCTHKGCFCGRFESANADRRGGS
jgi:hypothetical protein